MSTQAWLLAICNFVIFISVILSLFLIKDDNEQGKKGSAIFKTIIALGSFLCVMALQVYSLNCMVVGDCILWSWIVAIFATIGCIAYVCLFVYVVVVLKRAPNAVISVKPSSPIASSTVSSPAMFTGSHVSSVSSTSAPATSTDADQGNSTPSL